MKKRARPPADEPAAQPQAAPQEPPEPPEPPGPPEAADPAPVPSAGADAPPEEPGREPSAAPEALPGGEEADPPEGRPRRRKGAELAPPPPERLEGAIEALLLVSGDVLTAERLRDLLGLASALHVREALARLRERWAASGLAVELEEVAGGVRVVTRPEYAEYVRRLARAGPGDARLSQGQLETLSIVAYRQPVARPEIERIRGVQAGEALRALLDRRLVKVVGRSDQPGRPLLYGTTTRFLTAFGLNDVKDLPSAKELTRL